MQMNNVLTAANNYVRAKDKIVASLELMDRNVEPATLALVTSALAEKEKAVSQLSALKLIPACEGF